MNSLAIVTSGTKGIGRAIVELLLAKNFDVITCSRSETNLEELQNSTQSISSESTLYTVVADLSSKEGVQTLIDFGNQFNRKIDILVNNTGIFIPGQITTEENGTLEKTIETNLYSAYYVTRGFVESMIQQKSGHIFNMCSIASIIAYPNGGSYAISKFALYGMTKVLREELKPHGIRVTAVLPGATLTDSWSGTNLPEERFMKASDIASVIWAAYELSDRAVLEEVIIRPQLGDL